MPTWLSRGPESRATRSHHADELEKPNEARSAADVALAAYDKEPPSSGVVVAGTHFMGSDQPGGTSSYSPRRATRIR